MPEDRDYFLQRAFRWSNRGRTGFNPQEVGMSLRFAESITDHCLWELADRKLVTRTNSITYVTAEGRAAAKQFEGDAADGVAIDLDDLTSISSRLLRAPSAAQHCKMG